MNARPFIDTNILLYLFVEGDGRKAQAANEIVQAGGVVSVQVLNEFANVARRKARLEWAEISEALDVLKALLEVRTLDLPTHERGVDVARRYGYSFYDSLIIAAAVEAQCHVLLSEDMQDGQLVDGVTIRNPFDA